MNNESLSRREMLRVLTLASISGATAPQILAAAEASVTSNSNTPLHIHAQQQLQMGSEQIAILVYPEFTALDALGPHYFLAGMMGATVRFVAKTLDPVPCEGASKGGFCVKPQLTFADCPEELDLLLVPGGLTGTFAAIEDKATINFLKSRAAKTKLVGSVCTGSLVLGAAGLLKGRNATTHWQMLEVLKDVGATPVAERIVFDRTDRVTAAGVSAGLDLGLELVRRYRGDFYAKGMQLLGEYDPHPAFPGGGNPKTADPTAVNMLNAMHAPLLAKFRTAIAGAGSK
ncbi:MAG TPA: DJ-1/PfpI family protein [Verrucomicrobiae bacterium]|nr:DJ-1/PfpI family protein [Verrucomicrobiae bacterium]